MEKYKSVWDASKDMVLDKNVREILEERSKVREYIDRVIHVAKVRPNDNMISLSRKEFFDNMTHVKSFIEYVRLNHLITGEKEEMKSKYDDEEIMSCIEEMADRVGGLSPDSQVFGISRDKFRAIMFHLRDHGIEGKKSQQEKYIHEVKETEDLMRTVQNEIGNGNCFVLNRESCYWFDDAIIYIQRYIKILEEHPEIES